VDRVLEHRVLLETPLTRVAAVRCPGGHRWSPEEQVAGAAIVLVRRGVFFRRADGRSLLADVTTGYVQLPGESQQIAHPAGGDVCTSIGVPDDLAAHFGRVVVTAEADLAHRRLLAADPPDRADLVADLIAALLPAPVLRDPSPAVDEVRALLHADPAADLTALASAVGWSPWHLSRVFHRTIGCTLGVYRRQLRVRAVLDELPGAPGLAALAASAGFADQAHMTRAVRAETGRTPAALRKALDQGVAASRPVRGQPARKRSRS
jgi:AraC-like DNA-binding protein